MNMIRKTKNGRKLRRLAEAQGWKCYYCQEEMKDKTINKNELATIEHIYPTGDIRRLIKNPMVAAHSKCNQEKNREFHKKLLENYNPKTKPFVTLLQDLVRGKITL